MIRKRGGKYVVLSEKTGRSFGAYNTKADAERRLRQIEFFKRVGKRGRRRKMRGTNAASLSRTAGSRRGGI